MLNARSIMMVAGDKARHLEKIPHLAADWAMVNLEDGVGDKEAARHLVAEKLAALDPAVLAERVVIRLNPWDAGALDDLAILGHLTPRAWRLPKVESAETLRAALAKLPASSELHFTVETRAALADLRHLRVDGRVTTAYLGMLDLLADLGLPQSLLTPDNPTINYLLAQFLVECRMSGLNPVGFVYQNHRDIAGLEQWADKLKRMGYTAMGCIAPAQAEALNRAFAPDADAIARAQRILELFETSQANGVTGFDDPEFGFIDEPIARDARLLLSRAKQ
ncbi:HpcH/HpaI aldolase/citrate lyase family protein [Magnetofaba australis]|uniref:Putative HpcH/HpaI aldolase n=1 Tax=Magnetofaba australis IT-1 TaxID=1434232 RepID=A0A1Y2K2F3_9PROT|nr:aldolase/citrate lyase family protein [Magnetofaba australis]OSM02210.1 putative HpcH/HpaI aldolase [Magnetofaba australis IT-1]